ncbi:MAG TPA: DNA adenine methylase [Ktedonobacteraceae bacterium]|nr:DNA adenine methylase [Ktedonobacteraceae bacterium]
MTIDQTVPEHTLPNEPQILQESTLAQASPVGKLSPFLKWAGGKEQELKHILPAIPPFERYFEPFVGGGAVFFSVMAGKKFINDKSPELFHLYTMIAHNDQDFFGALDILLAGWQRISQFVDDEAHDLVKMYKAYSCNIRSSQDVMGNFSSFINAHAEEFKDMFDAFFPRDAENFLQELHRNLFNKVGRMKRLEDRKWKLPEEDIVANIESALKSAFYMHLRYLYNKTAHYELPSSLAAAIFFFVRENAYASMFRYNRQGEFNVPYGGISYNRKALARKVDYMRSPALQSYLCDTVIENIDFEAFLLKYAPQADDFVFLDPPYDSEFSTYAQNEFTLQDQERLARYLLQNCQARFMLVIKNTPAILRLYTQKGLTIRTFDKKYLVSFQDRNDKNAEHLMITNY